MSKEPQEHFVGMNNLFFLLAGKNREEVHLQRGVTEKQCCVDLENIAMTHTQQIE